MLTLQCQFENGGVGNLFECILSELILQKKYYTK